MIIHHDPSKKKKLSAGVPNFYSDSVSNVNKKKKNSKMAHGNLTWFARIRREVLIMIHRTEKVGDWYIYSKFVAHEGKILKLLIKTHRKGLKSSHLDNVVSSGKISGKIWLYM